MANITQDELTLLREQCKTAVAMYDGLNKSMDALAVKCKHQQLEIKEMENIVLDRKHKQLVADMEYLRILDCDVKSVISKYGTCYQINNITDKDGMRILNRYLDLYQKFNYAKSYPLFDDYCYKTLGCFVSHEQWAENPKTEYSILLNEDDFRNKFMPLFTLKQQQYFTYRIETQLKSEKK